MTVERWVRVFAGLFVVVSTLLGLFVNKWWFAFTIFVGLNLFQYGFTNFCPLAKILKAIGIREN
ncbi:MAG: DUF2892 domain-containing protein [Deferribacterales bacterium]